MKNVPSQSYKLPSLLTMKITLDISHYAQMEQSITCGMGLVSRVLGGLNFLLFLMMTKTIQTTTVTTNRTQGVLATIHLMRRTNVRTS